MVEHLVHIEGVRGSNPLGSTVMDVNKVYQGDCFELIKQIGDESINLIVCDGPFGVTENDWPVVNN